MKGSKTTLESLFHSTESLILRSRLNSHAVSLSFRESEESIPPFKAFGIITCSRWKWKFLILIRCKKSYSNQRFIVLVLYKCFIAVLQDFYGQQLEILLYYLIWATEEEFKWDDVIIRRSIEAF